MKRILAIALVVLMCASAIMLSACTPKENTQKPANSGKNSESAETSPVTADPTSKSETTDGEPENVGEPEFVNQLEVTKNTAEHKTAETLPSSFTLVGSGTLPKIDNRGTIDCQAAEAITYMQFTNAVARYVKAKDPSNTWDPAADYKSCYSPKSTFYGTGTGVAYAMLEQNGALTNAQDGFYKNAMDVSVVKRNGKYEPSSIAWKTTIESYMDAIKYRINGYSSVCTSTRENTVLGKGYFDGETNGIKITNSDNGKAFLDKIKDALATGNVVVTQGYKNIFVTEKLAANSGTLGKAGDTVVPYAKKHTESATWQLSIVGYDDDIEYTAAGATMKGAFLIANCEGASWGTNGYVWVMYDAFNTKSEFEEFDEKIEREPALDWFYFLYWDTNIVETAPSFYGFVELSVASRTAFKIEMQSADGLKRTRTLQEAQSWAASNYAWKYELPTDSYFNSEGIENGGETTAYYFVNFDPLLKTVPVGTSYEDYLWGLKITSTTDKYPVTVKSIHIKNAAGESIADLDLGEGHVLSKSDYSFVFDFGNKKANSFLSGNYKVQNVATGDYIAPEGYMEIKPGKEDDAYALHFTYDSETGKNTIYRDPDSKPVLDAKVFKNNEPAVFQPYNNVARAASQSWVVSYNEDGTFSFYIVNANGAYYALAEVDGAFVIVNSTELTDNMKWNVTRITDTKETNICGYAVRTEKGIHLYGFTSAKKVTAIEVKVFNAADGSEVLTTSAKANAKEFDLDLELAAGNYVVRIYDTANDNTLNSFAYVVTVK